MEVSDEMQCLWEWDKSLIFPFNAVHFFSLCSFLVRGNGSLFQGALTKSVQPSLGLAGMLRKEPWGGAGQEAIHSYVVPTTASTLVLLVSSSC